MKSCEDILAAVRKSCTVVRVDDSVNKSKDSVKLWKLMVNREKESKVVQ